MTNEEAQQLVQDIYDTLFNVVTTAESGGEPVMAAASTVLSLRKPGLYVRAEDFRNPWTPGNISGDQDAAVNTATLVDVIPTLDGTFTDSLRRISQVYEQILDGVSIPVQPPNPAIEKQLADADAVLYRWVEIPDPDTGVVTATRVQTKLYRDYDENQLAYNNATAEYNAKYIEAQKTETGRNTWPLIASSLQVPVKQAYDRWRSAGADRVEQALAITTTSSQNALQKAWDDAKKTFEGYKADLDKGNPMTPPIHRSTLLPSDWYSPESTGWVKYDSASGSVSTSNTSDFESYGGSAGFSLGLFTIGGSAGHSTESKHVGAETNNLNIRFQYMLVSIRRPWLVYNLLGTPGWSLGNLYSQGQISNGTKDKESQKNSVMPLLPSSFVVVKDLVISASWSKEDLDLINEHIGGGGGLAIGPFSIGGTYEHSSSKQTYAAQFANGQLTAPGVQIIGVISQVVPYSPPA